MPQPSGQVLVDSGHALAGTLFAYAHDNGGGGGLWDATSGAMLTKVGTGAVATEGGATVVTSAGTTHYTLASSIAITNAQAFSVGFRCRATANDTKTMVMGLTTSTTSYVWLNHSTTAGQVRVSGSSNWAANGGVTNMTTWWITKGAGTSTGRVYKDGVLIGTLANAGATLTINAILKGYNSTAFDFHGSLEFAHIIPGIELTGSQVESLTADPYQILQAASGVDVSAAGTGAMAWAGTGAVNASNEAPLTAAVAGNGAMSWAATGAAGATITSGTITLTSPAARTIRQRSLATWVREFTVAGTATAGAIEYRWGGSSWATLIASHPGGAYSQTLILPTGQGTLEVRLAAEPAVTASAALITVGDIYPTGGQSNHVGDATSTVAPVATSFQPLEYLGGAWVNLREGLTTADSYSGVSGYGGSYFGALANRLQANGVPVGFVPCAAGSTTIAQWQKGQSLYTGMMNKITAVGGVRAVLFWLGESDANNDTTQAAFEAGLNQMVNDIAADTGCKTFINKIVRWIAKADTIRAAQDSVIASNPNVAGWADCDVYAASGVHYLTTTDINNVADRVYAGMVTAFYSDQTAAVSGNAAMSWAASGAVSASVIPLPIAAAVAGVAAMAWAAQAGVSVTAVDPAAMQVEVSAGAAMSWAAAGAVSASILPPVAADVQGAAAMDWSARGSISAGEYIQPIAPETSMFLSVANPTTYLSIAGR